MVKQKVPEKKVQSSILHSTVSPSGLTMEDDDLLCPADFRGITVQDSLSSWDKLVLIVKVARRKWFKSFHLPQPPPPVIQSSDQRPVEMRRRRIRRNMESNAALIMKQSMSTASSLPQHLKTLIQNMEGQEILPLIEKYITVSDVTKGEHRLLMPMNRIVSRGFLREDERDHLQGRTSNGNVNDIKVVMIEPTTRHTVLNLKRWDMKKKKGGTKNYVLAGGWYDVVERNNLEAGDLIQLWSFRVGVKLHLLLIIPEEDEV